MFKNPLFRGSNKDNNDNAAEGATFAGGEEVTEDGAARDALEKKVRDRDSTVSALEKKRSEKEKELEGLRKELEEERLKQMEDSILHRLERERLQRQTKAMEERLEALERDMQDKEAIQEYANLIKSVAPENGVDSQYVMKLQSQLAKAVKKMDATSHQMNLVEESCSEVVNSLKSEIAEIVRDRCRTEFELRKQLELLEEQKANMQVDYEEQIRKNQEELERLKLCANEEEAGDIQSQLEETEMRLEELHRIHTIQTETIQQLNDTLDNAQAGFDDDGSRTVGSTVIEEKDNEDEDED